MKNNQERRTAVLTVRVRPSLLAEFSKKVEAWNWQDGERNKTCIFTKATAIERLMERFCAEN